MSMSTQSIPAGQNSASHLASAATSGSGTVTVQSPPNPFSPCGLNCASDLDYDHGFPRIFLPSNAAENTTQFRVEITSFSRDRTSGNVSTNSRRLINKVSALSTVLRDGSIASANAQGQLHTIGTNQGTSQAGGSNSSAIQVDARLTLITIPQQFSGGSLGITRTAAKDLISQLDLPTTFLPVLYAFGSVPRISEAGLDCFTKIEHPHHDGSFSICYLYRFKDFDQNDTGAPREWKDRQIGVFHRHCEVTNEDLFIVLQPHPNSLFDGEVEYKIQPDPNAMKSLIQNPFHLHQLLISSYFGGWREYLRDMADEYAKSSAEAFSQDIMKDYSLDFDFLQRWRNTKDSVAPISTTLDSVRRILDGLEEAEHNSTTSGTIQPSADFKTFLQMTKSQTDGLRHSTQALEKRITNIADLLTNTIETRNQMDAAKLNRNMERLTHDTLDDSTSVKIITFLSLFYLPGSFVATLFGMNLFGFDDATRRIAIADNFWLYVVIFLPLTAVTSGGAWMLSEKAKRKREERDKKFGILRIRGSP